MLTKTVIEGLLYESPLIEKTKEVLRLCHVLNTNERDWGAIPHPELFYLKYFHNPAYLCIIDKLLYVYIIGEKSKGLTYNILEICGDTTIHSQLSKAGLREKIKENSRFEHKSLFLPDPYVQRVVYIPPVEEDKEIEAHVFNRIGNGNLFNVGEWFVGVNIYTPHITKTVTVNAKEVLNDILAEV